MGTCNMGWRLEVLEVELNFPIEEPVSFRTEYRGSTGSKPELPSWTSGIPVASEHAILVFSLAMEKTW